MPKRASWMPKAEDKFNIDLGCMVARGKNKTEATENAIQSAKKALSLNYAPIFLTVRGAHAIIYQTPNGYAISSMIEPQEDRQVLDFRYRGTNHVKDGANLDSIIGDTLLYLAEQTWDGQDWQETAPFDTEKYYDQSCEYRSWLIFQARYSKAKGEGFTDNEAHHIAGDFIHNLNFPDFKKKVAEKIIAEIC